MSQDINKWRIEPDHNVIDFTSKFDKNNSRDVKYKICTKCNTIFTGSYGYWYEGEIDMTLTVRFASAKSCSHYIMEKALK